MDAFEVCSLKFYDFKVQQEAHHIISIIVHFPYSNSVQ